MLQHHMIKLDALAMTAACAFWASAALADPIDSEHLFGFTEGSDRAFTFAGLKLAVARAAKGGESLATTCAPRANAVDCPAIGTNQRMAAWT